jgi:serine/threonine-protein kinase
LQKSNYRNLGLVGHGQFGRVFCAIDRQTGDLVALKELDKRFPTHKFLRELRLLITLRHPNIVACQTLEYSPTGRYLVMDYCEGGTLRHLMESEDRLSVETSLQLVSDILMGLEYARSQGIVHCDIKPENILLIPQKQGWIAQISDFGIARLIEETGSSALGYTGTPAYMAPERFYGQYFHTSDLYAVGIILFELLVGDRPFSGMPGELMFAHINKTPEIPDTIPFTIRSILTKALQKLPQNRFASAAEMLKSIQIATEVEKAIQEQKAEESNSDRIAFESAKSYRYGYSILAVESDRIYWGGNDRVICDTYAGEVLTGELLNSTQITLNDRLVQLIALKESCFILTERDNNYSLYRLAKNEFSDFNEEKNIPVLSLQANFLKIAIDPQERWIAIARSTSKPPQSILEILKLPSLESVRSPVTFPLLQDLLALDRRHGLAVFRQKNSDSGEIQTVFRLFNRRGNLLESFKLAISLKQITPSATDPYRILAIEQNNKDSGLLIDLKPFRVNRLSLPIQPDSIVARESGFLLVDRQGKVLLLNNEAEALPYK